MISFLLVFIFFFTQFICSKWVCIKKSPNCEITNTYINCINIHPSEVMNIKLFNEPYRMQIKFRNKLIIKKI